MPSDPKRQLGLWSQMFPKCLQWFECRSHNRVLSFSKVSIYSNWFCNVRTFVFIQKIVFCVCWISSTLDAHVSTSPRLVPNSIRTIPLLILEHHEFTDIIPFSIRFVRICSAPLRFSSWPEEWPLPVREFPCILHHNYGICNIHFFAFFVSPFNVIAVQVHTASHQPYSESLWKFAMSWILGQIVHSNSIGSPSIRSSSRHGVVLLNDSNLVFMCQWLVDVGAFCQDTTLNLRRHSACWTRVMQLHSGHITAWYSRHDSDILLCTQTSWAQVGSHRKQFSSLCTAHFAPVLCRLPRLHGSGTGIPGIGTLIYSLYCSIGTSSGDGICSRGRDAWTSAWRAHGTDDWSTSTVIKHCDERSSVGTHGSRENNGTVGVETAPRGHESRKARAVRTWERLWRLGFHIQRVRGYTRSCLSCLAENSETITNSGDGDSTTRSAVCNIAVPPHDAHTERRTESGEKSWKQRFRSLQTIVPDVRNVRSGRQRGTIRANHDLQVRFQDWRRGRPSERISGTGETIRWGERYRSRSRPSEKGVHYFEHAWASEETSSVECWKTVKLQRITRGDWRLLEEQTHLQDDFSRKHTRRRFNGSRRSLPKGERERQREIRQGKEG